MKYIKELDSLRAIAILFVLCNHWLPPNHFLYKISTVISAPDIFFTISVFLITMILLKDRNRAEEFGTTKGKVFTDFFLKRAFRIMPAYYFTILVTYILRPKSVPNYGSYLNFTANFDMYNNKYYGYLAHLWSMSVEQQFYLIWPLLILFIPKKILLPTILCSIIIGIVCQNIIIDKEFMWFLPQTCIDALGIGALLAWVVVECNSLFTNVHKVLRLLGILSIALIVGQFGWSDVLFIHHRTMVAIIVAWAIAYFISLGEDEGRLVWLFNNRVLLLIGKISYGIYLYHLTIFFNSNKVLSRLNYLIPLPQPIKENNYFFLFENLVILLALAWFSWRYFELPLSNLKRYLKTNRIVTSINHTALK